MNQDMLTKYCEFVVLSQQLYKNASDDYINFLRFCEERLHRGDQVQVIWLDYQNQEK